MYTYELIMYVKLSYEIENTCSNTLEMDTCTVQYVVIKLMLSMAIYSTV